MMNLEVPGYYADVFGLGLPVRVFSVKKINRMGSLVLGLLSLVISVAAILGGVAYTYTQVQHFGPAIFWGVIGPFLAVGGIMFFVSILFLLNARGNWKKSAVLYERGLAVSSRKGVSWMRWDEIESLQAAVTKRYTNGIYTGTTHIYTILSKQGDRHILNDALGKVEELADCIRQNIFPLVYARCSDAYNRGDKVSFGPVTLSQAEGIQIGKKIFPWSEVSQVSVNNGFIRVGKKAGGIFSGAAVAAAKVPNMEVMLSLVNQVVGVKLP